MKRKIDFLIVALFAVVLFASCERVAPNYAGVLMENYGKQGKEDFKIVAGKVSTWELGTELFQVPLFDQRGEFSDPVTTQSMAVVITLPLQQEFFHLQAQIPILLFQRLSVRLKVLVMVELTSRLSI